MQPRLVMTDVGVVDKTIGGKRAEEKMKILQVSFELIWNRVVPVVPDVYKTYKG